MDQYIDISILYRKLENRLSQKEEKEFQVWYNASEEHRIYFKKLEKQAKKTAERKLSQVDTAQALSQITKKSHRSINWRWTIRIAAIFILFIGLSYAYNRIRVRTNDTQTASGIIAGKAHAILKLANGKRILLDSANLYCGQDNIINLTQKQTVQQITSVTADTGYNELIVPVAGEYQITLEDGTRIFLNSATTLKYPVHFSAHERRISLNGEAYLQVAYAEQPFIVETLRGEIKVFGTEFNVMTYTNETEMQTTLVKGSVGVSTDGKTFQKIVPGQLFAINNTTGTREVRDVEILPFIAWKDGLFVAQNENLESIMKKISRWYDVEVFYQHPSLKEKCFFGIMKRQSRLTEILEIITEASNIKFKVNKRVVTVYE